MDIASHLFAIAGLIVGLVIWYNRYRRAKAITQKIKGKSPPEPSGAWPIIGHLHLLRGKVPVFRTLSAIADKLGPVFVIQLGMYPTLVVSHHEAVKECFSTNDKVLASRPGSAFAKIFGYNYAAFALAPYGPLWREMRKLSVLELLSNARLSNFTCVQVSELDGGIKDLYMIGKDDKWVNPKKVVMSEWFEHLTLNVILRMIAGKGCFDHLVHGDGGSSTKEAAARSALAVLIKKFMGLSGATVISDMIPFLEWLDLRGHLSSMKLVAKEMDTIIESWVEEHEVRRDINEASKSHDFVDVLLSKLKDASFFGYSRQTIIKATIVTMLVAATDTTSITFTWLLSVLLNNRQVMKHAQEEIDLKVGKDRWVEQSDIQNLVYLNAIVKETLRLYPAGPLLLPHEVMEDCCIGSYHIPKGTHLLINAWKMHRDPNVWSNPEEFQPDRFLTNHPTTNVFGQHFELIPFGSGRRSCPGIHIALQTLHLTIGRLLQGFDMTTPLNSLVDMTEGISLAMPKATPLEIMITPRLHAKLY